MTLDTAIRVELAEYLGWDYSKAGAPSLVAKPCRLAPDRVVWRPGAKTTTVCCVVVAGVLGRVYDADARWSSRAWQRCMVPADEPWAMLAEFVDAGIGVVVPSPPQPGRWYAAQGWKGLVGGKVVAGSSGHQWLQYGPDLLVEATTWTDEDADGKSTDPGAVAWRHRTWSAQLARYDEVRLVELREPA